MGDGMLKGATLSALLVWPQEATHRIPRGSELPAVPSPLPLLTFSHGVLILEFERQAEWRWNKFSNIPARLFDHPLAATTSWKEEHPLIWGEESSRKEGHKR